MLAPTTPARHSRHFAELSQTCSRVCLDTAEHCESFDDENAERRVLHVFERCARLCQLSLSALTLDSQLARQLLLTCHAMCVDSARLCAALIGAGGEDRQLESCAKVCLDCAESCETLLESAARDLNAVGRPWRIRIASARAQMT